MAVTIKGIEAAFDSLGYGFTRDPEATSACVELAKEHGLTAEEIAENFDIMNTVG
jgi:hypothetical protein